MSAGNWKEKFARFRISIAGFFWKTINDWSLSLSALIAYYMLISLLPILLSIFSIAVMAFGNDEAMINKTLTNLVNSFPNQEFDTLLSTLANSVRKQAWVVFIISFLVSIFTASRLFIGIDDVLTIVYRTRERTILQQNIHAIRMLLLFVILMPVIIVSGSITAFLKANKNVYYFLITFLNGIFTFLLILLIFYFVPKPKMRWSRIWCGALVTSVGTLLLTTFFPMYVQLLMSDYVGQMGFIIVVLLLFYIFGFLFVIGAQINSYFFDQIKPLSSSLGNVLYEYSDRENLPLLDNDGNMSTFRDGRVQLD